MKLLNIIVCCDNNYGIGRNNELPWTIKEEMRIFKNKTIGNNNNCVIMGKNTYQSINKKYFPLKNRKNVILSSTMKKNEINDDNIIICNTHYDIIEYVKNSNHENYWIIGGSKIYNFFLNYYINIINQIHISVINENYSCDTFFPKINNSIFEIKEIQNCNSFMHYVYENKMIIHDRNMDCH